MPSGFAGALPPSDEALLALGNATAPHAGDSPLKQPTRWLEAGLAILNPAGLLLDINEALGVWLEQPRGELIQRQPSLWKLLEARCGDWKETLATLRDAGAGISEHRLRLADGAGRGAEWYSLELARGPGGSFVRLHSILPPLSELEEGSVNDNLRAEVARRDLLVRVMRAEAQLQTLTEQWPGVIFSQRSDLSFRFVSPKIEELTGVSVADWNARPQLFWNAVHESDTDEVREHLRQARLSGCAVTRTFRLRHAQNGRISYVLEHRHANLSAGGLLLGYEGVWLDVTRQTIAEKRLSSAAWKESLSVLTMGLAHDFSNVMAGIHALSETIFDQVGAQHEFSEGLTLIKRNAQQASQLVHRIINLHQGRPGENSYYNLNDLATDMADLIRKIIPRKMRFTVELSPEQLPVYLDAIELRQVVINLVLNAIEATPPDGNLRLKTGVQADAAALPSRLHGAVPRLPAACLLLEDTGRGIKPRHLTSLFDPFFTTKQANKGSGLGLYNARLFVEKHRGAISVDSAEGAGSTFGLWLPLADFTEAEAEAKVIAAREAQRGPAPAASDTSSWRSF